MKETFKSFIHPVREQKGEKVTSDSLQRDKSLSNLLKRWKWLGTTQKRVTKNSNPDKFATRKRGCVSAKASTLSSTTTDPKGLPTIGCLFRVYPSRCLNIDNPSY